MAFLTSFLDWCRTFNKRNREGLKITNACRTAHACPVCTAPLYRIVVKHGTDPRYHCNACGYDGLVKNHR